MIGTRLKMPREKIRTYLPYNTALYMLMIGSFAESQAAFERFLEKMPSLKHKLIYCLIKLSSLIRCDLVNPMSFFVKMEDKEIPYRHIILLQDSWCFDYITRF